MTRQRLASEGHSLSLSFHNTTPGPLEQQEECHLVTFQGTEIPFTVANNGCKQAPEGEEVIKRAILSVGPSPARCMHARTQGREEEEKKQKEKKTPTH